MLQLGDVLVPEEDVRSFARRGDRLRLVLRWPFEDLSVLLELPAEVRLTWHADDDPKAGILGRLVNWCYRSAAGVEGRSVSLVFEMGNTVAN